MLAILATLVSYALSTEDLQHLKKNTLHYTLFLGNYRQLLLASFFLLHCSVLLFGHLLQAKIIF